MYAVSTDCLDPRKPLEFNASHPVGELYSKRPWLRDLPEVRSLFRLILAVYCERFAGQIDPFGRETDRTEQARALMFFRNIPTDVLVGSEPINLYRLFRQAIRVIAATPQPAKAKVEGLEAFTRAVAALMHHVRVTRPPSKKPH